MKKATKKTTTRNANAKNVNATKKNVKRTVRKTAKKPSTKKALVFSARCDVISDTFALHSFTLNGEVWLRQADICIANAPRRDDWYPGKEIDHPYIVDAKAIRQERFKYNKRSYQGYCYLSADAVLEYIKERQQVVHSMKLAKLGKYKTAGWNEHAVSLIKRLYGIKVDTAEVEFKSEEHKALYTLMHNDEVARTHFQKMRKLKKSVKSLNTAEKELTEAYSASLAEQL